MITSRCQALGCSVASIPVHAPIRIRRSTQAALFVLQYQCLLLLLPVLLLLSLQVHVFERPAAFHHFEGSGSPSGSAPAGHLRNLGHKSSKNIYYILYIIYYILYIIYFNDIPRAEALRGRLISNYW